MKNFSFSQLTPRHVCSLRIPSISEAKIPLSEQSTASMTSRLSFVSTTHSTETVSTDNKNPTQSAGSLCSAIHPSLSSPITIAFNEFLLVPTVDGRVLIYQITDFQDAENSLIHDEIEKSLNSEEERHLREKISKIHQQKNNVEAICTLGPFFVEDSEDDLYNSTIPPLKTSQRTKAFASIAHICSLSANCDEISYTAGGNWALGVIAILTNEGNIHIFEFNMEHTAYSNGMPLESGSKNGKCVATATLDSDGRRLSIYKRASIFTGKIGANCVTFHYAYNAIERHIVEQKDASIPLSSMRVVIGHECGMVTDYQVSHEETRLIWMGSFNCPVRSICSLGNLVKGDKTYLAVGLVGLHCTDNESINSFLETIDVTALEKAWTRRDRTNEDIESDELKLDEFCTWPAKTIHLKNQNHLVNISAKMRRSSRAFNRDPCARQQLAANIIGMDGMKISCVLRISSDFSI